MEEQVELMENSWASLGKPSGLEPFSLLNELHQGRHSSVFFRLVDRLQGFGSQSCESTLKISG